MNNTIKALKAIRQILADLNARLINTPELRQNAAYMQKIEIYQKTLSELYKDL